MLAPQRLRRKQKLIYGGILAVLIIATGWVLYRNFFAGGVTAILTPPKAVDTESTESADRYQTGELDFLQDTRFKQLRRFGEPIAVPAARTGNPFAPSAPNER